MYGKIMQALILAAGKGERMRPLTLIKPKPLLEVCGTTLLEHHLINLEKAGYKEIVINVSWLAQQIMKKIGNGSQYNVSVKYSHEGDEPLETGGGIVNALKLLKQEAFLVVNADIKSDFCFSDISLRNNSLAHLVLVNNPQHHPNGDFSINSKSQLNYSNESDKLTYSGIGIYHPEFFKDCRVEKFKLAPLLRKHMDSRQITGQQHLGQWSDIGTIDRLSEINLDCKKK
jgi:MurNAc alpha-1-phosphate uridylyltransferase